MARSFSRFLGLPEFCPRLQCFRLYCHLSFSFISLSLFPLSLLFLSLSLSISLFPVSLSLLPISLSLFSLSSSFSVSISFCLNISFRLYQSLVILLFAITAPLSMAFSFFSPSIQLSSARSTPMATLYTLRYWTPRSNLVWPNLT